MLNVIMLSVVMLNVIKMSVVMLNVIMLNVVMLSVVVLNVVAPILLGWKGLPGENNLAYYDLRTYGRKKFHNIGTRTMFRPCLPSPSVPAFTTTATT
jgi:hypothetical protein